MKPVGHLSVHLPGVSVVPYACRWHRGDMADLIENVPFKGDASRISSEAIYEFIPSLSPMGRQKGWLVKSQFQRCLSASA